VGPVTANGLQVFDAQILTPAGGAAWHADLRVDSSGLLSGPVTVVAGNRTLVGTAIRSEVFVNVAQVRVLAGAGGIGTTATPRHYTAPTVGLVLADILGDAREALSPDADPGLLATELEAWTTLAEPAGAAISRLLAAAAPGATWAFRDDGTLWVGTLSWPDAGIGTDAYEVMQRDAERGFLEIAVDGPLALAGTTFEGGRVNMVQDDIPHVEGIRARIWFQAPTAPTAAQNERLLAAIHRIVRGTPQGFDHRFRYWARVVSQAGPTVDAEPAAGGVPSMPGVPLAAQAGDSVDGVVGGNVLLGWAGNGSQRVAHGFDAGAVPAKRTIQVLTELLLGGPEAAAFPALVGSLHQEAEAGLVQELIAAFAELSVAATGPLAALGAGFAAVGAALTAYQTAAAAANNFLSTKVASSP
jgi:hypothetical protein